MRIIEATHKGRGGVHPEYHKDLARNSAVAEVPLPKLLRVSMSQHLGAPAKSLVKRGDEVLRGQRIGEPQGFISAAVHAPTSGKVKKVSESPTLAGPSAPTLEIEPDGEDRWVEEIPAGLNIESVNSEDVVARVADAGIVGMGGAGFPTHVKLSPPKDKSIDTLIVNGAECEPFLTADFRLMLEQAEKIWAGVGVIRQVLGAKTVRIAIEDNKPEAIDAMQKAAPGLDGDVAIAVLKTEYPQGAEKQQIQAITGREVPSGGLPMDVGCLVENVGTTVAVWDAVVNGRPLTERITTVTGTPVKSPGNVQARTGTPLEDLIAFCGGIEGKAGKIIAGGPMMGLAQPALDIGTTKTTSGLLLLSPEAVSEFTSMPCISCGRCVRACPSGLMPSELSVLLEAEDFETAAEYSVMDCIECGCCAFVCPAHRPMVQHMRRGKAWVAAQRRK